MPRLYLLSMLSPPPPPLVLLYIFLPCVVPAVQLLALVPLTVSRTADPVSLRLWFPGNLFVVSNSAHDSGSSSHASSCRRLLREADLCLANIAHSRTHLTRGHSSVAALLLLPLPVSRVAESPCAGGAAQPCHKNRPKILALTCACGK